MSNPSAEDEPRVEGASQSQEDAQSTDVPAVVGQDRGDRSVLSALDADGNQADDKPSVAGTSVAGRYTIPALGGLRVPQVVSRRNHGTSTTTSGASAAKEKYSKLMPNLNVLSMEELLARDDDVEIVVPKSARGKPGDKQYSYNLRMGTEGISNKFGVAMFHTIGGEVEEGDQTKSQYIQDSYVGNLEKLKLIQKRCAEMDYMAIFKVPKAFADRNAKNPTELFALEDANLLSQWELLEWDLVCAWQLTINLHMGEEERTSSKWSQMLFENSCTTELREQVDQEYSQLDPFLKGGVTYAYLLLNILFVLNRDTIAALQKFLKLFQTRGLQRMYKGESVTLAKKQLLAVCQRLHEGGELPSEAPIDILEGLVKCSCEPFAKLFDSFLQDAKKDFLKNGLSRKKSDPMSEVQGYLSKAWHVYDTLCTAGTWNVPKATGRAHNVQSNAQQPVPKECWNCEKLGHTVGKCKEPRDEARIARNRDKFYEAKNKQGGDGGGGPPKGKGGDRKKWTPRQPSGGTSNAAIKWVSGVPQAYCGKQCAPGKTCGYNATHSSKWHAQWARDGDSFDLSQYSPNHGLVQAWRSAGGSEGSKGAAPSAAGAMSAAEVKKKLTKLEPHVQGEEAKTVLSAISSIFG